MIDYRDLMRPPNGIERLIVMGGGAETALSYDPRNFTEEAIDPRYSLVPREWPGIMDGGPSGERVLAGGDNLSGDEVQYQIASVLDVANTKNTNNAIPIPGRVDRDAMTGQVQPVGVNIAAGLPLVSDAPYLGDIEIASPMEGWVVGLA